MKSCPSCGALVQETAEHCYLCGINVIRAPTLDSRKYLRDVARALLIFVACVLIVVSFMALERFVR